MCTNRDQVQIYDTKWKKLHLREHITCFRLYDILERQNDVMKIRLPGNSFDGREGVIEKRHEEISLVKWDRFYILIVAVVKL